MTKEKIKVIGVPGRIAFTAAQGGERIQINKPVRVLRTSWIERRLNDGDIIIYDERKAANEEQKLKRAQEKNQEKPIETLSQEKK